MIIKIATVSFFFLNFNISIFGALSNKIFKDFLIKKVKIKLTDEA